MLNLIDCLKSIITKNKYKKFTIETRGNPNVVFDGVLIASAWGFWGDMYLFRTRTDNYVCHFNASTIDKICVIDTKCKAREKIYHEIINFFGYCRTAKKLYKKAGINQDVFID